MSAQLIRRKSSQPDFRENRCGTIFREKSFAQTKPPINIPTKTKIPTHAGARQ